MRIEFCGAAQTVTGSQHLVEVSGKRILFDCGMYQGRRETAKTINRTFLYDPQEIDCVILSHAHIDHSGNLPSLVKRGFRGKIYATPATRDLCSIMLTDSAMIQQKDAEHLLRHRGEFIEPLYTLDDVTETMSRFCGVPYNQAFTPWSGFTCTFFDAGHILGSAISVSEFEERGKKTRFCFTGDVGRYNRPILRDPQFPGDVDVMICESTYGGRYHEERELIREKIVDEIDRVVDSGGKLMIPAFSIGRTQEVVYILNQLYNEGKLNPRISVYVDSPLSYSATQIFRMHPECFDDEFRSEMNRDDSPFDFKSLHYIRDMKDSKRLNQSRKPAIIISASGMCEGGRIVHHLSHNIGKERNTVLMLGFCAEYTLGRKLSDGEKNVRIMGVEHKVRARVVGISGLSAHADHGELTSFLRQFDTKRCEQLFFVHGEPVAQQYLIESAKELGFAQVSNPRKAQTVQV